MIDLIRKAVYTKRFMKNLVNRPYYMKKIPDGEDFKVSEYPKNLSIESTTKCNAFCNHCPIKDIKRTKDMPIKLLKKIIDDVEGDKIENLFLHHYGEPFMHKEIVEFFRYARHKTTAKILLFSNGSIFDDRLKTIIKEGLIDSLNFSIDAASGKTFNGVKKLDYNKVISNIEQCIEFNKSINSKVKITVSFIISDYNKHEIFKFWKKWHKMTNVRFGVDDDRKRPSKNKITRPCSSPFEDMIIFTDGKVVPCCIDYSGRLVMGDINKNTVKEIWNSRQYIALRRAHNSGKRQMISMCAECLK